MKRIILVTALVLGAIGCGEQSFILIEVDGSLSIPNQVNGIDLNAEEPDTGSDLAAVSITLADDDRFPLVVFLEPSDTTPTSIRVTITATLDTSPVASCTFVQPWERGKENRSQIDITSSQCQGLLNP